MTKFVAVRDNFGYLGTYWKKGDVVIADTKPNDHFEKEAANQKAEAADAAARIAAAKAADDAALAAEATRKQAEKLAKAEAVCVQQRL